MPRKRHVEEASNDHSKSERVYRELRRRIREMELTPGSRLRKNDIADEAGMSRAPINEAIARLADEGLIDVFPQSGSFVAPIRPAGRSREHADPHRSRDRGDPACDPARGQAVSREDRREPGRAGGGGARQRHGASRRSRRGVPRDDFRGGRIAARQAAARCDPRDPRPVALPRAARARAPQGDRCRAPPDRRRDQERRRRAGRPRRCAST